MEYVKLIRVLLLLQLKVASAITSDMQGMVWGEPERGSAQNGIEM